MRSLILFTVVFLLYESVKAQATINGLLSQLDSTIAHRESFINVKLQRIEDFKRRLTEVHDDQVFLILSQIYDEYKSFKYDSAAEYALKIQEIAYKSRAPDKVAISKINTGFILTSAGLLNEALDSLKTVRTKNVSDQTKSRYYSLMIRTLYDLADFSQSVYYTQQYCQIARAYVDSASSLLPVKSVDYLMNNGLRALHDKNMPQAKSYYEDIIHNYDLNNHQFAIVASTLSFIYSTTGNVNTSTEMLIKAAIADIRSSTKEANALLKLAELVYKQGDIERAYRYIKLAMEDAEFYGTRFRRQQVAAIFPVIEGERVSREEAKKQMLLLYSVLITAFVGVFSLFFYIIKRKNNKLERAQQTITRANNKLEESNKIKEEYLWYFFNIIAEYIGKMDALKSTVTNKLLGKKIDELKEAAERIDIKQERNQLFHNFDVVFLKLFPDFVQVFNSLLNPEHRIIMKDGQLLSVEMRIFALIRLGIHDHEKIAKILGYSLTTIYTYKTRIKAKAVVSSEEFDNRIENIPTL